MTKSKRPNIIIINPDEMRADTLSHLGCRAIRTNYLDELAQDGASFETAFCQNPVCVPSRCSFLTGWYPHVAGHRTMASMLSPEEPLLFRYLKQDGYYVWSSPRNDYLPAQRSGYYEDSADTWYMTPEMETVLLREKKNELQRIQAAGKESFLNGEIPSDKTLDELWVDGACAFLRGRASAGQEQPFCLFLPLQLPHPPYQAPKEYLDRVDRSAIQERIRPLEGFVGKCRMMPALHKRLGMESWTEKMYEDVRASYLAMCLQVDDLVGRVIRTLKECGLYDDAAVFVLSDHGDFAGDYDLVEKQQNSFEDCLTRVPFLIKLPKGLQLRHGVQSGLVELVDFYATVEELAGYTPQHTHFGHSLIPFLGGTENQLRDAAFCEGGFRRGEKQCFASEGALPNARQRYYPRVSLQLDDTELYNGKAIMCRTTQYKYIYRLYEADELYDLLQDPHEIRNLAKLPEYEGIMNQLRLRLLKHYLDTSDVVSFQLDSRQEPQIKQRLMQALFKASPNL